MAASGEERTPNPRVDPGAAPRQVRLGHPVAMPWDCHCAICGRPITPKEKNLFRTCDDRRCRERHRAEQWTLRREQLERDRLREQERRRNAAAIRDRMAGSLGIERPEDYVVAIVPANPRSLAAIAPERRRAFRAYLEQLVREAGELAAGPRRDPSEDDPACGDDASLESVLAGGCATCAGHCCLTAGDQAHLEAATIRRFLDEHPTAQPSDVIAAYESHLGETIYQDSCICHGPQGCVLPRALRSDVCESFECAFRRNLRRECSGEGAPRAFVAAMQGEVVVRFAFVPPPPQSGGT